MSKNKSIYLAKSKLADERIVRAIERYLIESGYIVYKYMGGQYNEGKEEVKMQRAESMIVIPGTQHEFIDYRRDMGVSYQSEVFIDRGLQKQIESFTKINNFDINIVLPIGAETAIEENSFDDIEEILDIAMLDSWLIQPKHMGNHGFEFGNWVNTYSLLQLDIDTENQLDEAYPKLIDYVKPVKSTPSQTPNSGWEWIDKHMEEDKPIVLPKQKQKDEQKPKQKDEVNYLLMASIL